MSQPRDRWASRLKFILAAVGLAVGLGNVWRFPYVAYENGGGAFMIPYLVALFTAGIPLLMLEFGIGQRLQKAAPQAMEKLRPGTGWIGWWAVGISLVIVAYYAVIMAWAWNYLHFSLTQAWGNNANSFFYDQYLSVSESPGEFGSINLPILGGLALTWISIYLILRKGLISVGKVVIWTVPLPVILLLILVIRGVTLDGAMEGLSYYLTPDLSRLLDPEVWLAAYGQVFFSVGIGWGIMIAYASYRPGKTDITNNAFITALLDGGISFLAGFAVFSTVGYLAHLNQVPVPDAVQSGFGLAFVAYPTAISQMPFLPAVFGIVFFLMLLTLGIDSAFGMVEAVIAAVHDEWKISKKTFTLFACIGGFLLGLPFVFDNGIYWLDIVDHWACAYGLAVVGLLECIIAGWMIRTQEFRMYLNAVSDFRVGNWWTFCIRFLTPVILLIMFARTLIQEITPLYGDYPSWSLWIGGWGVTTVVVLISVILHLKSKMKELPPLPVADGEGLSGEPDRNK